MHKHTHISELTLLLRTEMKTVQKESVNENYLSVENK